jgi:hypothetical protein
LITSLVRETSPSKIRPSSTCSLKKNDIMINLYLQFQEHPTNLNLVSLCRT